MEKDIKYSGHPSPYTVKITPPFVMLLLVTAFCACWQAITCWVVMGERGGYF